MNDTEVIWARNPLWAKLLGVVMLPVMTGTAIWLISRPIWEEGITSKQYIVGLAIGSICLYQCIMGLMTLKYLNTRILITDDWIEIHHGARVQRVEWKNAAIKNFALATTYRVSDKDGNVLFYAGELMKNFRVIKAMIAQRDTRGVSP